MFFSIICSFLIVIVMTTHTTSAKTSTTEVFIATSTRSSRRRQHHTSKKMHVLSPIDAATAINSERFINLLVGEKGSKDVKTYTQKLSSSNSGQNRHLSNTWSISKWMMFGGARSSTDDGSSNDNDSLATSTSANNHAHIVPSSSHETITEYKASLWFLSNSKGMRFRETIRILSISPDGQSSTVECISQYHNGSKWVDCSKVICNFSSVSISKQNSKDNTKVRMILDGEVLVWLPLPKSASRAVGKKIINVFEQAALTFFDELATS